MDLGIAGKRAAVAAASKGLGFASARALAAEGVRVAICGRDRDTVEAAAARIGGDTVALVADVGTVAGATGFVEAARAALGGVDILVPNAGGPPAGDFAAFDDVDAYARAFELNALSTIAMCKAAVPAMQEQGWGRVAGEGGGGGGGGRRHPVIPVPPADPDADPVEHGPRRRHRLPEDAR